LNGAVQRPAGYPGLNPVQRQIKPGLCRIIRLLVPMHEQQFAVTVDKVGQAMGSQAGSKIRHHG
jgi:hypothetical protein